VGEPKQGDASKPFDISKGEVWRAYQKVKGNKGAPGVDKVSLGEFEKDLKNPAVPDLEQDVLGRVHRARVVVGFANIHPAEHVVPVGSVLGAFRQPSSPWLDRGRPPWHPRRQPRYEQTFVRSSLYQHSGAVGPPSGGKMRLWSSG
jgi:hypothetical protein